MSRGMKKLVTLGFLLGGLGLALSLAWLWSLHTDLNQRLDKEWFTPPVEFYYGSLQIRSGHSLSYEKLHHQLIQLGYRERLSTDPLQEKDFYPISSDLCSEELQPVTSQTEDSSLPFDHCLRLRSQNGQLFTLAWQNEVIQLFQGVSLTPHYALYLEPQLIGEFQAGQPLKRKNVALSEIPLYCLQAVTAIEDDEFLKHKGISPSGMARALMRNLLSGRFAQGGSTITQQLIKNYFLTHEKTLKRKITEQALSVMLETKISKDQILEKYLNVIYMGQDGPYQIIGFGSAAPYYFSQSISNLDLSSCALLAAIINNPGRYNPFRHPEEARERRELVLKKMQDLDWITPAEMQMAQTSPLPLQKNINPQPSAPYFLELAYQELLKLNLPEERGFKVLTTLSPKEQVAMEEGVKEQLPLVQKRSKSTQPLEAAAIRVHLPSFQITSLVGGSRFQTSPYNRALLAKRQVGSIIKPLIYWQAFKTHKPWDLIQDEAFSWSFDGRTWTPRNYERRFSGEIPLYEALVKSINVPAAKLAQEVGLESLRDLLYAAGLERPVDLLPSLALGAVEITPLEMAQIYSTIGNMGSYQKLSSLVSVRTFDGETLYEAPPPSPEERLDPVVTAQLVSTLKLTSEIGTARGLKAFVPTEFIAGKTGTTNDLKDSWFVGFTADHLMVVWVGRDDNETTHLTGASGALPLWGSVQKKQNDEARDFKWPKNTESVKHDEFEFRIEKKNSSSWMTPFDR